MFLLSTIKDLLPKEIIDYIGEFNPEHREKMKYVLLEIIIQRKCYICNKIILKGRSVLCLGGCCSEECLDSYESIAFEYIAANGFDPNPQTTVHYNPLYTIL